MESGEAGRADWAVHVARWERTGPDRGQLTAGAVALPARDQVLSTAQPPPAPDRNGPDEAADGPIRVVVSRTRPPLFVQAISDPVDIELAPLGSAGAKVAAVILGEAEVGRGVAQVKNLRSGTQEDVALDQLATRVR